ncbi:hypothetical protein N39L_00960 [Limnospira platensis NIES-39]|uniref:Transposase n=1 Tax=Limnospira platensis NIES-46 TaxID=1236695 RepID=A0A5M3T4U9_LIMPL|nr:hypothetical protein AP285_00260 [Arthrospira platensis YZ]BDT10373.1 hypothetical protein N39L_00960 [Arthrospira platensis NIES-39]GCE94504.1 hypothetical protein NIES46_25620 [Arthrospira platensis NIES-46]
MGGTIFIGCRDLSSQIYLGSVIDGFPREKERLGNLLCPFPGHFQSSGSDLIAVSKSMSGVPIKKITPQRHLSYMIYKISNKYVRID